MFRRFIAATCALVATLSLSQVAISQSTLPVNASTLATDGAGGWVGSFDVLHWSVREAGNQYAITDIGGVQDRGAVGSVLSLGGKYDTGYRIALGRRMKQGPELMFQFTDFDTWHSELGLGSHRSVFVSSDNGENNDSDDNVNDVTPDDRATQVLAGKAFDYRVFDVELAQTLVLTDSLSLRLGGGGRAASVDQAFTARYTGGDFQVPFSAFKTGEYRGGGIMAGGDLIWRLLPSLKLSVGSNMGMMMGTVDTRVFIPDDEPGVPTDVTFSETRMTPVLDMNVGINFQRQFGKYWFSVAGGYEMTNWFNLADTRVFTDAYMEAQNAHLIDDISLDGAYFRIALNR